MPTAREVTDPLGHILTRVPPWGPGVCFVCHGAPKQSYGVCFTCSLTYGQLDRPAQLVVPVSLVTPTGQLYQLLRDYKVSPYPDVRREFAPKVASLLIRFITDHRRCIRRVAGRAWSEITVVPSSRDDPHRHALETALEGMGLKTARTLYRGPGLLGPMVVSEDGYRPLSKVDGKALLLVDDTYNTGARLHSAASALQRAGADVVAAVPIGRLLDPGQKEVTKRFLARVGARPFSFDECCLEEVEGVQPPIQPG